MSARYKNIYRISDEVKEKVYNSFNRTSDAVKEDVETIKAWMRSQPHLPEIMEDAPIRNFLNMNKYSIEKTKQKIDNYYTLRSLLPAVYKDSNPKLPRIQEVLDNLYLSIHPKPWNEIHRVYLAKPKFPNTFLLNDEMKLLFNLFEIRLFEDFVTSDIFIFDFDNFTLSDVKEFTPTAFRNLVTIYQKIYSLRLKEIHYMNAPSFISLILNIIKASVKQKIFDRIEVHTDTDVLKKFFSDDDLPSDYGGKGLSLEELNDITRSKFLEYQDRFDVLDTLTVDESLRPEKINNDEILGYYGNFKKIDID